MYTQKMIRLFAVALTVLLVGSAAQSAQEASDPLLNTLPADCIGVLRVNNLNDALTKIDTYLAGASPVPLTMMVNMQLAAITGDPALTGIDKAGSFVLIAMPAGEEEVAAGLLVPVTSFDEFIGANQFITKSEDGTALLKAPQSPVGGSVLSPVLGGKYALAMPEEEKELLAVLKSAIENKTSQRLSARLNAVQAKEAVSAPVWGFVNLSLAYDKYGQDLLAGIEETMQAASQEATAGMMAFAGKMYSEMFKEFAGDADSLTFSVQPEAALLTIDTTLRSKDGSELAKMLQADPAAAKDYKLAGFADNAYAVNGAIKINQPLFKQYNEMMIRIMDTAAQGETSSEQSAKTKELMNQMMQMLGSEVVFSFSYAAGTPPMRLREVFELKEGSSMKSLMEPGLEVANAMYKSMGFPFAMTYKPGSETYKGVAIDALKLTFSGEQENADEQLTKEFEKIYGPEGIEYYMAQKGRLVFVTMGSKGLDEIKGLIDQQASPPAGGDIKQALDLLAPTGHTDAAVSINVIRLMKGLGEMLQSITAGQTTQSPFTNIFSGLNLQSQSSLVIGSKVADGQLGLRTALPKQHLIEIVTAAMQIQQQMMQQQQQMQQQWQTEPNQQQSGAAAPDAAMQPAQEATPLKSWVGKKAPELRMVDLNGQTHRVSRLKGKKVVLDFWATWCAPCKESIPHLIDLRAKTAAEQAVIIGLTNEPQEKVSEYVKTAKINYPIAIYTEEVPAPYGEVTGLPTLFLIDAEGTITDVIEGYDPETTPAKVEAFLK